jgi:hypothetical protein
LSNEGVATEDSVAEQGWVPEPNSTDENYGDAGPNVIQDVDTPEELDDETDVVPETTGEGAKSTTATPKAPARATPPDGYITPVAFAKILTKHLAEKSYQNKNGYVGRTSDGATIDEKINPIPPQYIYSMLNQGNKPNAKNPIPTYVSGHNPGEVWKTGEQPEGTPLARVNLLDPTEALAWWDAKDERIAASKKAKEDKAKAAAEKAAATPAAPAVVEDEAAEPVTEAE